MPAFGHFDGSTTACGHACGHACGQATDTRSERLSGRAGATSSRNLVNLERDRPRSERCRLVWRSLPVSRRRHEVAAYAKGAAGACLRLESVHAYRDGKDAEVRRCTTINCPMWP